MCTKHQTSLRSHHPRSALKSNKEVNMSQLWDENIHNPTVYRHTHTQYTVLYMMRSWCGCAYSQRAGLRACLLACCVNVCRVREGTRPTEKERCVWENKPTHSCVPSPVSCMTPPPPTTPLSISFFPCFLLSTAPQLAQVVTLNTLKGKICPKKTKQLVMLFYAKISPGMEWSS